MDSRMVGMIINASEEYRRLAVRLAEILPVMDGMKDSEETKKAVDRMYSQIRSLNAMADSLQEIGGVFRRACREIDSDADLPEIASVSPEFGISEFANLEKHEKLLTIHMD